MAVELAKVALWIEAVEPGMPLGFLDANIRCGDSLLGVFDLDVLRHGIPDAAYKKLTGDDKDTATFYRNKNKVEIKDKDRIQQGFGFNRQSDFTKAFARLRTMPEGSVRQIEAKAKALRDLTANGSDVWQLQQACDLYMAAFLLPKIVNREFLGARGLPSAGRETVPTSRPLWDYLRGITPFGPMVGASVEAARSARAFHWPLEFPDVMVNGGFDVVLGNPPWERLKLEEKEFFATSAPEIASAKGKSNRLKMIQALGAAAKGSSQHNLHLKFLDAKRKAEAISEFVRLSGDAGGRFVFTGTGDVNTYALFAELFSALYNKQGQAGVMVPTGIATNDTTAPFFDHLVTQKKLKSLFSYSEIKAWFSGTKDNQSFSLVTLGKTEKAEFCFRIDTASDIEDPRRRFEFTPEEIVRINPNTKTAPVFRSRADAELTAKIYQNAPVLIDESLGENGNPWGVSFARLFDMSNDSGLFRSAAQLDADGFVRDGTDWVIERGSASGSVRYLPLYEAKMVSYFDHRWGYYPDGVEDDTRALPRPSEEEKKNPAFDIGPRFWVDSSEIAARLNERGWTKQWLLGHRGLTNNTNERTFITSLVPRRGAGNSFPVWVFEDEISADKISCLYANTSTLTLDFVVRNKIGGTNLNYFYLKQFPFFAPDFYTEPRLAFITPKVLELTYTSHSLAPFARDLGHEGPPFAWDEDRRALLRAYLDVFYARAYGLTRDELRFILDPSDIMVDDYPSETFRVLKNKEIKEYGEYRTQRLVLEAWDRFTADGTFRDLGLMT